MGIEMAKAYVTVKGDASGVASDLKRAKPAITSAASSIASGVNRIFGAIGATLSIGALINEFRMAIPLAERQIQAEARVAALVKATGGAAGRTAKQLKEMAAEMQKRTTFGDEEILESMALLLTFKSVSGEAFDRTLKAAQDLSASGYGGVVELTKSLAKAIEDPKRQMSLLRRSGVTLSEVEEKRIKQMQESGDLMGAQAALLSAIEGQAEGAAEALAKTPAGRLQQARNALGDMREELGNRLIPLFTKFIEWRTSLQKVLITVIDLNSRFGGMPARIALATAAAWGLTAALKAAQKAGITLGFVLKKALIGTGIGIAFVAIGAAIGYVWQRIADLEPVSRKFGDAWSRIKEVFVAVVQSIGGMLESLGIDIGAIPDTVGGIVDSIINFIADMVLEAAEWFQVLAFNMDKVWGLIKASLLASVFMMLDIFKNFWNAIPQMATAVWETLKAGFWAWVDIIGSGLQAVWELIKVYGNMIVEFWTAVWNMSWSGMKDAMSKGVKESGKIIMDEFKNMDVQGKKVGDTLKEGMEGIDLLKPSDRTMKEVKNVLENAGGLMAEKIKIQLKRTPPPKEPKEKKEEEKKKREQAAVEEKEKKEEFGTGFSGFADYGRKIQEAMLKGEADKIAKEQLGEQKKTNEKLDGVVGAIKDQKPQQEGMLAGADKP
jgi:hypothetical protein